MEAWYKVLSDHALEKGKRAAMRDKGNRERYLIQV
jgi:hypothetical protein